MREFAVKMLMEFKPLKISILNFAAILIFIGNVAASPTIKIGSKHFHESYILAEIMAQLLEDSGFKVERKYGLGGTLICYQALLNDAIDIYPEYSGTIEQAILKLPQPTSYEQLQNLLSQTHGLELLESFGFNNTYALTVRAELANQRNLETISDLRSHPGLRYGLSYEFMKRADGWGAIAAAYGLTAKPVGMEHVLAYPALAQKQIDVTDVYSTDAEIQKYGLAVLEDDKRFFPNYLAAPLVRSDLPPDAKAILKKLLGKIDEPEMRRLNAEVAISGKPISETANGFLKKNGLLHDAGAALADTKWSTLAYRTWVHLKLTVLALLVAMILAIPFAVLIYRLPGISRPIIYIAGLLQTIPSLALLAFMIPFFGIGVKPALIALFLYALLPILRSTFAALNSIDPILRKVATGMGLTVWQRLRYVEIPLASPNILAGIRTSAVILIGTATLAAIIGAGGLGEYIFTGVSLNDPYIIMWGAIPAAILAIIVELLFEGLEKLLIPKHLLQKQAS